MSGRLQGACRRAAPPRWLVGSAVLLVATAMLVSCGANAKKPHARLAAGALRQLVLLPRDARGFSSFDTGRQVTIDAHSGPRHAADRFGRQDGWKARYRRDDSTARKGPLIIESRADVFADEGGAAKDLGAYEEEWKRTVNTSGATSARYPDVRLGDDAKAFDLLQGSKQAGQRLIVVAWRRGRTTASISASGYPSLTLEDAMALARKQDRGVRKSSGD